MSHANRLFESLGPATRERLRSHVDVVQLTKGRVMAEAGDQLRHAYFPVEGSLALLGITEDGRTLEVATVGDDGFVGVPLALNNSPSPYQVLVQMPGTAHRVRAEAFIRECLRCEDLHALSLTYAGDLLRQTVQSAVCQAFHPLMQRVCRWLLVARDCAHAHTFELTQENLADMLGVSRPKVSHVLVTLEVRGLIHQGRGRIHIVDPRGLQHGSCRCYRPSRHQVPLQQPLRPAR